MTLTAEAAQNYAMFDAGERKKQKDREDVLRAIYAMQQAGLSPDEMRQVAMGAAGGMNLAGGYGLLDPAIRMAGVNSAYKLGRAGVAQTANDQAWGRTMDAATMAGKPQNIVSYLDLLARSNTGIPLNNPIVENIRPMFPTPAGSYDDQIGDFLGDNPDAFAGGGRYMMDGGPKVLMDADTGMIDATMNENGGEGLSDLPGGGVRVHPGKDKRLGKYRQSKIVKDARRQKPKHMMDGEMMEGMPMAAHGADFQPPAWSYGDQLAGSRAYQDEWADWQAQNPGMALSEMVRTFPGLGNYFKYRFNPYTDSGRTGYRAHNRFTPAGDTAAPGDAGIATGERGGEAPVGGVPRGPGFRDEPYAPTPPRALPVFPRDRPAYDPDLLREGDINPSLPSRRPLGTVGLGTPRTGWRRVPAFAGGGDLASNLRAAYAAFHPAGQSRQESAAIDRAYGGMAPGAITQYDAGPQTDPRYGSSTGTRYGQNPVGRASYIRDAEGNLTAAANADPTAFQYGENGVVKHAPGSIIHEVINGRTVSRALSDAEAANIAGEMRGRDIAYRTSRMGGSLRHFDPETFWGNMSDYGSNMKNWPKDRAWEEYTTPSGARATAPVGSATQGLTSTGRYIVGYDGDTPIYGERDDRGSYQTPRSIAASGGRGYQGPGAHRSRLGSYGEQRTLGQSLRRESSGGGGGSATDDAGTGNNSQQAAAKLLAAVKHNTLLTPEFVSALEKGEVPGLASINRRAFNSLPRTQQQALIGLWISTGQATDEQEIMDQFEKNTPAGG